VNKQNRRLRPTITNNLKYLICGCLMKKKDTLTVKKASKYSTPTTYVVPRWTRYQVCKQHTALKGVEE